MIVEMADGELPCESHLLVRERKAQDVGGRNVDIPHPLCPLGNQSAFREQLSHLGP